MAVIHRCVRQQVWITTLPIDREMGLGANEDGLCSSCEVAHLRPWGTQCLAYKGAVLKCQELNIDISEYKHYLDLNLVRYSKDLPKIPETGAGDKTGQVKDEDIEDLYRQQIKQLTEVNLQQKAQIDALVQQQQLQPSPPTKVYTPPKQPTDQSHVLQQIWDRLQKLESGNANPLPAPGHGAGVLSAGQPTSSRQATGASSAGLSLQGPGTGVLSAASAVGSASKMSDSPAVAAMGQMAEAMAQLSLSIDPSSGSKSGQLLRPEYHLCVVETGMPLKSADASKLSINEYLYGMCLVLEYLVDVEGNWKSYLAHYKRMMKFCVGKKYVNSAYISYDKEVIDCYLKHPGAGFNSSDSLAIPPHFCSANEHETYNARNTRGSGRRGRRGDSNVRGSTSSNIPEDRPEEECYVYNSLFCVGNCNKQHVCAKCRMRGHKIGTCRVNTEKN